MSAMILALVAVAVASTWRALAGARAAAAVGRRLGRAAGPDALPRRLVGSLVALAVGTLVGGPVLGIGGAAVAAAAPAVAARRRATAATDREVDGLPDAVDGIARALRAGVPPIEAVRIGAQAAPPRLAADLAEVARAADRGMPLAAALDRWSGDRDAEGPRLVAAAVAVNAAAGGEPSRSLAAVADTLRERRALRREIRALSSQARLSATVIAIAPGAFGILAAGTDRATATFLLRTPLGGACLLAGAGLEIVGWRWMDRIARSVR